MGRYSPCILFISKRQIMNNKTIAVWFSCGAASAILINVGFTKQDCLDVIKNEGISPPRIYNLGFPNANCIGCVKSTSPTYWNLARGIRPDIFEQRCLQSRSLGCRLVRRKGKRIFLDKLLPTDKGGKIKSYECGIFCDIEHY